VRRSRGFRYRRHASPALTLDLESRLRALKPLRPRRPTASTPWT
jgi:hypothetical protein